MHWNHRIVDMSAENGGDPWVEVRECHYDERGAVVGHGAICAGSETPEDLIAALQRMIDDIKRNPTVVRELAD